MRSRIIDILQHADLTDSEIQDCLKSNERAILGIQKMNVEIAREMLFFVAELKIHRSYVYRFGIALGCPEKQLLRHDLCKLHEDQFEGYVRYFRGGRQEKDRPAFLTAWEHHQCEEHHRECYDKETFNFDTFPKERLRNNMLEAVADLLAATKQREGTTPIDWLVKSYAKKSPHPRLLPFLRDALMKAHALYLDSDPLFQGLPCWNHELEKFFQEK